MSDKQGVVYIVFGEKAQKAAIASIQSLRKLNPGIDILVIGDETYAPIQDIPYQIWQGQSPFDGTKQKQFHFRAGRVKPFLYQLSPFDKTLYVDADTEFQANIQPGFDLLNRYDFMLAKHSSHNVGMLTNQPSQERLTTIRELGGDGDQPYPNSGVLFWRKNDATFKLFASWYDEWMRFQEWDEQLALMRALFKNPLRLLLLPEAWNGENRKEGSIIFHDFHGQQIARTNIPDNLQGKFTTIYDNHYWASAKSKSGPGSEISHTEHIREMLPVILKSLGVKSFLDAGCGDWNWMSQVDLSGLDYHGCDIVPELIKVNQEKYGPDEASKLMAATVKGNRKYSRLSKHFFVADLTKDKLPENDLILCRAVLFHLSFANVSKALANFKSTGAKWLWTSTYPQFTTGNQDIKDGNWHKLNLEMTPFNWPMPYLMLPEGNELDGWLALWRLDEIR